MIQQLVLVCWRAVPHTISFHNPKPSYTRSSLMAYAEKCRDVPPLAKRGCTIETWLHHYTIEMWLHYRDVVTLLHYQDMAALLHYRDVAALSRHRNMAALPRHRGVATLPRR